MLSATLEEQDQMLANGLREDQRPKINLVLNPLFRKRRPDISKIPLLNPTLSDGIVHDQRRDPGIPDGLVVRIPGFHPGGPGSIPGLEARLLQINL